MKKLILLLCVALSACDKKTTEIGDRYVLPKELSDCKVFRLSDDGVGEITAMRCPNSSTSVVSSDGKTKRKTIVVDGVTYEEKAK